MMWLFVGEDTNCKHKRNFEWLFTTMARCILFYRILFVLHLWPSWTCYIQCNKILCGKHKNIKQRTLPSPCGKCNINPRWNEKKIRKNRIVYRLHRFCSICFCGAFESDANCLCWYVFTWNLHTDRFFRCAKKNLSVSIKRSQYISIDEISQAFLLHITNTKR